MSDRFSSQAAFNFSFSNSFEKPSTARFLREARLFLFPAIYHLPFTIYHLICAGFTIFHRRKFSAAASGILLICCAACTSADTRFSPRCDRRTSGRRGSIFAAGANFARFSQKRARSFERAAHRRIRARKQHRNRSRARRPRLPFRLRLPAASLNGAVRFDAPRSLPMKPFHRFALTNLSKSIAVSGAVAANLQKFSRKKKIALIANGISIDNQINENRERLRQEFRFMHDIPFDAFLIGTVGELKLLKGQRDFILAANVIAQKFPEARFVIVGKDNSFKRNSGAN